MELDFRKDPTILSTVVDTMADGVFTVDSRGRFVAWSAGAERITGYTAAEVIGQPCEILEGPNCKGFGKLSELLATPNPPPQGICNQECKLAARDGRELYILGNVRLLHDENGQVSGAVGTFTDVTQFILANQKIALLEQQARGRFAFEQLVGKSRIMEEVFHRIHLAAESDVTVFLSGESGTGKELAARAIHARSPRKDGPFIAVNCSAIPETLLESELFGHVKGAFTGAIRDKIGMFQAADKGTLFLDEIGDVSPLLQLKLLRVIQEREIRRVGDDRPMQVDVRLITATNRDLKQLVQTGDFREDFYYRIHVFEIPLPPLRERRDDIPLLVDHFIRDLAATLNKPVTGIARDALERMMDYDWPGNVRELRNAVEHAFVTVNGDTISLLDLPPDVRRSQPSAGRRPGRTTVAATPATLTPEQQQERERIVAALEQTGGNRTAAARLLETSRVTLWKKIRKYAIEA